MIDALPQQEEQLVTFRLADETYGIPIVFIQEIIRFREITRIPRTTDYIRGVVNLRGKIVPVIDLRRRLGLPPAEETSAARIIVVQVEKNVVGLIVDAVTEVLRLPAAQIEPPSDLVADIEADFVRGVGKQDQQLVILLDAGKVTQTEA